MFDDIIDASVGAILGILPMSSWTGGTGTDPRKRLYRMKFAWVPVPLIDSEKRWAWLEQVGVIRDMETGGQDGWYSQARIARGKLCGEMESLERHTADIKARFRGSLPI